MIYAITYNESFERIHIKLNIKNLERIWGYMYSGQRVYIDKESHDLFECIEGRTFFLLGNVLNYKGD